MYTVLLEDKQKFKHGGVWSVSYLPWGSKEACKEAQKTQEKAKPAAQGEAPNDPKTRRSGNLATTTASGCHGLAVVDTTGRGAVSYTHLTLPTNREV